MYKIGRTLIPKPLKEEMNPVSGAALEMGSTGEAGPLAMEYGVWIFQSGAPLAAADTDEMLERIREERDFSNANGSQ